MISQHDYDTHATAFDTLVSTVHGYATLIFILTFMGYGFAVFLWFQDHTWTALIVATLSYLFFRGFRPFSLWMARRKLQKDPACATPLMLLDQALAHERPQAVLAQLDGYSQARRKAARQAAGHDDGGDSGGNGGD